MNAIREEHSDDRLMELAVLGNTWAFDAIVRRHQHRLQRFASRMLGGDTSRSGDVAVGAFLRLWEGRHAYQPTGRLEAWLLRTAYRLCLDTLAQMARTESLDDVDEPCQGAVDGIERRVLTQAVQEAVMGLPEAHRAVLVLSVYEEMSYEDISHALDIPAGTVASRKNKAIEILKRRLAAWEEPR